ncbi:MAG: hypothetical protein QOI11_548, partial [Candidatus Eremiobacteraeota bacterium]|nr:hypothetical protein [Candidatus Eremiobacteraeota bacterium]
MKSLTINGVAHDVDAPDEMPSIVVTLRPAIAPTGAAHERIDSPSTCTVQAPHCATPQPYLVPVSPR